MNKPDKIPAFDSVQVRDYLKKKYKTDLLYDIIPKVCFSYHNGSLLRLSPDLLIEENYPQLSKKERTYLQHLFDEFGVDRYGDARIYFWW